MYYVVYANNGKEIGAKTMFEDIIIRKGVDVLKINLDCVLSEGKNILYRYVERLAKEDIWFGYNYTDNEIFIKSTYLSDYKTLIILYDAIIGRKPQLDKDFFIVQEKDIPVKLKRNFPI